MNERGRGSGWVGKHKQKDSLGQLGGGIGAEFDIGCKKVEDKKVEIGLNARIIVEY